jgi:hypothetical protein
MTGARDAKDATRVFRLKAQQWGVWTSYYLGWQGAAGALILVLGLLLALSTISAQQGGREHSLAGTVAAVQSEAPKLAPEAPLRLRLPKPAEVPSLIAKLVRACNDAGIVWAEADYRLVSGKGAAPGALEVSTTLRGTYPQVRQALSSMLLDTPSLTLANLSIQRESASSEQIQASVKLVVFLGSDAIGKTSAGSRT